MSPRSGGPANQSGILYQNSIAALYMGRLCDAQQRPDNEAVIRVRVETPDKVDDTVVTFADNHKVFIQAKENIQTSGKKWSDLWDNLVKQYKAETFNKQSDRLKLFLGDRGFIALEKLCSHAYKKDNYKEWFDGLTLPEKGFLENITRALPPEMREDHTLLQFINHIDVDVFSLEYIEEKEVYRYMPPSNRSERELFRLLRDRVGGEGRREGDFNARDLRKSLREEAQDMIFNDPLNVEQMKADAKAISSQLLQHRKYFGDTEVHYVRPTVAEIADWLSSSQDEKNVAVLVDQAGMGKSVIMQDVVLESEARGLIPIALKADQQLQSVSTFPEIQHRLGLSLPFEQIVQSLAKLYRVVVLIDQIDALSLALAHDDRALDLTLGLVARLRYTPNVRILISCRLFDLNSDPRLTQIDIEKKFTIHPLREEEIKKALLSVKVNFDSLSLGTKYLLKTPLHLDLLIRAVSNKQAPVEKIHSLQELYKLLWANVISVSKRNIPSRADRNKVILILFRYMERTQKTVAPDSVFYDDDVDRDLDAAVDYLASSGIIIKSGTDWLFLHQTFIDYYFARNFVEQRRDIIQVTLNSPQGLFDRSKLLQVMGYLRGYDHSQYLSAYDELVNHPNLRFHLKDMLIRWLGALPDPTDDEWQYLQKALSLYDSDKEIYLNALQGNSAWFERLQEHIIPNWLNNSEDAFLAKVLFYLRTLIDIDICQKKVIELLGPCLNKDDIWVGRLMGLLAGIRVWHFVETAEFFEKVIQRLPSVTNHDWYQINEIAKAFPKVSCRLIHFAFEHTKQVDKDGNRYSRDDTSVNLDLLDASHLDEAIKIVCEKEPELFLEIFLPWLIKVLGKPEIHDMNKYRFDWDMFSYHWNTDHRSVRRTFVYSLINAMGFLCKDGESGLKKVGIFINMLSNAPFATSQRILSHFYFNNSAVYSQEAAEFLLGDLRRLSLGESAGYDSCRLIHTIYPFLSKNETTKLEEYVLQYRPIHKYRSKRVDALRDSGIEQLYLLRSIPEILLSMAGKKCLGELERKFPNLAPLSEPEFIGKDRYPSIPRENTNRMSDQNWLKEINNNRDTAKLSGNLREKVKEEPERFFRLLDQIRRDMHEHYAYGFINGLSESNANPEWLFETIQYFLPNLNRGENSRTREISWVIEKHPENVPADIVEWLISIVKSPMGEDELRLSKEEKTRDISNDYINSNRGAAFEALFEIYRKQETKDAINKRWTLIEFARSDPSVILRVGAIQELIFLIQNDQNRAIDLFEELVSINDVLLTSMHTREFIYWSFAQQFLRLYPHILKMMNYENDKTQTQGAELTCIATISTRAIESEESVKKANELAQMCVTGNKNWRRGAARVFAFNVIDGPREICEKYLTILLTDEDEQVISFLEDIFRSCRYEHMITLKDFIESYSKTSFSLSTPFCEFLLNHGVSDIDWTLKVLNNIVQNISSNKLPPWQIGADELIRLTLQIYSRSASDQVRQEAMNIFDNLLKYFSSSAQKILSEWDS